MDDPLPLNQHHPGWNNLSPRQQNQFVIKLKPKIERSMDLSPDEIVEMDELKDIFSHGVPVD